MTRNAWTPPGPEREIARGEWRDGQLERRTRNELDPGEAFDIRTAPHMEVGVHDSDADDNQETNPNWGVSIWPGGLVAQMLCSDDGDEEPFLGPAATSNSDHRHQLLPHGRTALVTQQAASEAAADAALEFQIERAKLNAVQLPDPFDDDGGTLHQWYVLLLGLKLLGTPRNVSLAMGRNGTFGLPYTISSADTRWGQDHWGLFELDMTDTSSEWIEGDFGPQFDPEDVFQLKVWADGAGAEMRLSHIYWIPRFGSPLMVDTTSQFHQTMALYQDYMAAHATGITDDNDSDPACVASDQYVSGSFDAAYEVSCGGAGNTVGVSGHGSQGLYEDDFGTTQMWEPRHFYQEARLNMLDRASPNVAFARLYRDSFEIEQVPITSQDWGLVYWGPWHHTMANLHWGLWMPRDIDDGGTHLDDVSFDDADREDLRLGKLWFPRDLASRPIRYVTWP